MTQCEKYERFINDHTDITLKYMLWEEQFLEPQLFDNNTKIDADDIDFETID